MECGSERAGFSDNKKRLTFPEARNFMKITNFHHQKCSRQSVESLMKEKLSRFHIWIRKSKTKKSYANKIISFLGIIWRQRKIFPKDFRFGKHGKVHEMCQAEVKLETESVLQVLSHSTSTEIHWGNFQLSSIPLRGNVCLEISVVARSPCFMIWVFDIKYSYKGWIPTCLQILIKGFFIISLLPSFPPCCFSFGSNEHNLLTSRFEKKRGKAFQLALSLFQPPSNVVVLLEME